MQTLEEYLLYWGFNSPPFSLAPQPSMFYSGGQYYECLEKLKYGLRTKRGGGILVSEEAGLGKTTLILRLIEEAKEIYGETFRYVFIEHPSFDAESLIASITMGLISSGARGEKFLNLRSLREFLMDLRLSGGHCLIVIDEAHLFKDSPSILQELRMLMNMTCEGEYLHTLILSGLKELWSSLSSLPEFWQRLTIRCYLSPLSFEETRNLVGFRIEKAGSRIEKIFSESALYLIHKLSNGCPRTVLALCDFSLLQGFGNRILRIGEKEVLKAYETLCGKKELETKLANELSRRTQRNLRVSFEKKEKGKRNLRVLILLNILLLLIGFNLYFSFNKPKTDIAPTKDNIPLSKEEIKSLEINETFLEISVPYANVRESPHLNSRRLAILAYGERVKVEGEEKDKEGQRWFRIRLFGQRYGWISEKVVRVVSEDAYTR